MHLFPIGLFDVVFFIGLTLSNCFILVFRISLLKHNMMNTFPQWVSPPPIKIDDHEGIEIEEKWTPSSNTHHLYYFYQLGRLFSLWSYLAKTYREYCNDLYKVVYFNHYFLQMSRLWIVMLDITLCRQRKNTMIICLYSYVRIWSFMDVVAQSNVWIGILLDTNHISLLLSTCCMLHVSLIGKNDINIATKDTSPCGRDEYKRET